MESGASKQESKQARKQVKPAKLQQKWSKKTVEEEGESGGGSERKLKQKEFWERGEMGEKEGMNVTMAKKNFAVVNK